MFTTFSVKIKEAKHFTASDLKLQDLVNWSPLEILGTPCLLSLCCLSLFDAQARDAVKFSGKGVFQN